MVFSICDRLKCNVKFFFPTLFPWSWVGYWVLGVGGGIVDVKGVVIGIGMVEIITLAIGGGVAIEVVGVGIAKIGPSWEVEMIVVADREVVESWSYREIVADTIGLLVKYESDGGLEVDDIVVVVE